MAPEKETLIAYTCNRYPNEVDKERLIRLFQTLDKNGDGRIDINELHEAITRSRMPALPEQAQVTSQLIIQYLQLNF